jgi:hypothetical protein
MSEDRPPIPDPVKREVRQRCGFGCVFCGTPLYQYHHMDDNPKHNIPENITLLCCIHHEEATKRLLTSEQIAQSNSMPYNIQHGVSSPYGLHFQGESFHYEIGGNTISSRLRDKENSTMAIAISVDDIDLLGFRIDPSGNIYLNANIFNENNRLILVIDENWLNYRTMVWDIEFKGRILTFREVAHRILFEIEFNPPGEVVINRARLLCNGVDIRVTKSHVFVVNTSSLLVNTGVDNCDVGLQFGRNDRRLGAAFSNPYIPRFPIQKSDTAI